MQDPNKHGIYKKQDNNMKYKNNNIIYVSMIDTLRNSPS